MNKIPKVDLTVLDKKNEFFTSLPDELTGEFMVRLWRATQGKIQPTTELHRFCDECEDEYPELRMTADQAVLQFAIASKRLRSSDVFADFLDAYRRKGPVVVGIEKVKTSDGVEHVVKNGYIEPYSNQDAAIRHVSDIMAAYARYNRKTQHYETQWKVKDCTTLRIPYVDVVALRAMLRIEEADYNVARQMIFRSLKTCPHQYLWFYCMQVILHHNDMEKFRVDASAQLVKWFESCTKLCPDRRFNKYYWFKATTIPMFKMNMEQTWRYSLESSVLRGMGRKKGVLSSGYYSFPTGPTYSNNIPEARDVISALTKLNLKHIELLKENVTLASILVANGFYVKCSALSSQKYIKDESPPGIYGYAEEHLFLKYRPLGEPFTLDKKSVRYVAPDNFFGTELRSAYITTALQFSELLPSTRVAEGVVMQYYNSHLHSKCSDDEKIEFSEILTKFLLRFCNGVTWRNNYLFTKVPYAVRDPYSKFFQPVIIPRLGKGDQVLFTFDDVTQVAIDSLIDFNDQDYAGLEKLKTVKEEKVIKITDEIWQGLDEAIDFLGATDEYERNMTRHYYLHATYVGSEHSSYKIEALPKPYIRRMILDLENRIAEQFDEKKLNDKYIVMSYYRHFICQEDVDYELKKDIEFEIYDHFDEDDNDQNDVSEQEESEKKATSKVKNKKDEEKEKDKKDEEEEAVDNDDDAPVLDDSAFSVIVD